MAVLVAATSLLFGASWGNPAGVAVLIVAAILAAMGIMALIATLAKNAEQAGNWQMVVAVVLGLLGGTFFPVSQAPGILSQLTFVDPRRGSCGGSATCGAAAFLTFAGRSGRVRTSSSCSSSRWS
jgi:ABC-2 type transport system permease protein